MKILLLILFFFPLSVLSQDTIHIPYPAAKAIVQQLVSYDSVKAVHELTKEQLTLTEREVEVQDSMIADYQEKVRMYRKMIDNEQQKFDVQNKWTEDLRKDVRKLQITNKIYKTGFWAGLFIGTVGYIILTK